MEKAIFLDRDGVINVKAEEYEYITYWKNFIFLPNVLEAICELSKSDYKIIILTNQRGISRGKMTIKDLEEIHGNMIQKIISSGGRIDKIYFCPHGDGECDCRKPSIGMAEMAKKDFNLDLHNCWLIGDSKSDILLGKNIGCKTIFIGKQKNYDADYFARSLIDSVGLIY